MSKRNASKTASLNLLTGVLVTGTAVLLATFAVLFLITTGNAKAHDDPMGCYTAAHLLADTTAENTVLDRADLSGELYGRGAEMFAKATGWPDDNPVPSHMQAFTIVLGGMLQPTMLVVLYDANGCGMANGMFPTRVVFELVERFKHAGSI